MVAGSDAAFRRHLSRLSPEAQAAFVADLLGARGWRTTVRGVRITATAVVGPDGLVERLEVTYPHVRTASTLRIRYAFEGGAEVTPPEWIEEAREGTA